MKLEDIGIAIILVLTLGWVSWLSTGESQPVPKQQTVLIEVPFYASDFIRP